MNKISTCLIVKNESSCIRRCIESITSFSDEIVIFDTGSDDGTQDICREYEKVRLIQGEWRNDFAWARNESFKYASNEFIMWVDADDFMNEESQKWLINFKENELDKYDEVDIEYVYDMGDDGKYSMHFYRERIFRKSSSPTWKGRIHEYVYPLSHSLYPRNRTYYVPFSDASIWHFKHVSNPKRNYEIYKIMEDNGEIVGGRDWFYYGRECMWSESDDLAIEKFKKASECEDMWNIDRLNMNIDLYGIYLRKNDMQKAKECLYLAASCTKIPRADVCCYLGDYYYHSEGLRDIAKKWYEMAYLNFPEGIDGTFMTENRSTVYPALQLCVISYEEGDIESAVRYNNSALEYSPNDSSALNNKKFFESL